MTELRACEECRRHVSIDETACPFCGADRAPPRRRTRGSGAHRVPPCSPVRCSRGTACGGNKPKARPSRPHANETTSAADAGVTERPPDRGDPSSRSEQHRRCRTAHRPRVVASSRSIFDDQLELALIERQPGRALDLHEALALAGALHLERAVMTHRVVARLAEQHLARPRAAALADVGVVAARAVAPQRLDAAVAVVAHRRRALPDVDEPRIAHVAAAPRLGRQRRATLDRAVGLDADAPHAGAAADV